MSSQAAKIVVDTNVPITANLDKVDDLPGDLDECVRACIIAIRQVMINGGLVLDADNEIFKEYIKNLSLSGQPGPGDAFIEWVHNRSYDFPDVERVEITKNGDSYHEFPDHDGLAKFDHSDRKFVAVANAHPEKPPILQATDSKWWGWKDALAEVDIHVDFVCRDYIEAKFKQKMES